SAIRPGGCRDAGGARESGGCPVRDLLCPGRGGQRDLLHCFPTRIRQEVNTEPAYRFSLQLVSACARRRSFLHLTRWVLRRDGGSVQARAFAEEAAARVREEEEQLLGPVLTRETGPEPETVRGDLAAVRQDLVLIPCEGETRDGYRAIRAS